MRNRASVVVPALLFSVAILWAAGEGFWIVPAIWLPVALVLLALRRLLLRRTARIVWLVVLLAALPVLWLFTFEGGEFVLPAAVALLVADAFGGDRATAPAEPPVSP